MALVQCSECKKEISDRASACPNCGNPIAADKPHEVPKTIQFTKKKWKAWKAVAMVLAFGGMFLAFSGYTGGNQALGGLGVFLVFIGLIVAIIANIGSWWSTG